MNQQLQSGASGALIMSTMEVRVTRSEAAAVGIRFLELRRLDGAPLPPFAPGAHIDVHLPNGLVRQYSLCNDPTESDRYQIGVLREPSSRGGSATMHKLAVGDVIRISTPRNHFPLANGAPHHLLLAGGIGVTPLLSMARVLARVKESFELHYCARDLSRAAFRDIFQSRALTEHSHLHFDDGDEAQKLQLESVLSDSPRGTHLYVCGPGGFIEWVLERARSADWHESCLHREYFLAQPSNGLTDDAFEVQIASSGQVIKVGADQSVLRALHVHGIDVPASCEQGVCGTCVIGVREGTPDHRDLFLTPEEQAAGDRFTPCCSRSKSQRLVLDL